MQKWEFKSTYFDKNIKETQINCNPDTAQMLFLRDCLI